MSLILVLSRLCDPSSDLYIAEHAYQNSALVDLLGVPPVCSTFAWRKLNGKEQQACG